MTAFAVRPDLSLGSLHIWERHRDVIIRLWKSEVLTQLFEPVLVILALGIGLGQFVELETDQDYLVFITPGIIAMFAMFAAVFECTWGSYVRLEMQGTYRAVMATPVSVDDIITGEILWGTTRALINTTFILVVAAIFTPWQDMLQSPLAILILPAAVVPGLMFASMSMAFASIARAMSQFNYFFNLVVNPMFWFGGAFFPFDAFPGWVQTVGWFIPLTHVINVYRGLIEGNLEWAMLGDFAWLIVATGVFYWLALVGMRRRLIA